MRQFNAVVWFSITSSLGGTAAPPKVARREALHKNFLRLSGGSPIAVRCRANRVSGGSVRARFRGAPCVRGSAEEACLIQDGTNPACPVNAKQGRPFLGVTAPSIHWGCQPPPGFSNIGLAVNCLWQEFNGTVALNGVARLIGGCPANSKVTDDGNCVCNPGFEQAENSNSCVANLALAKNNGSCTDSSARGTSSVGNPCNPATETNSSSNRCIGA